MKKIYIYLHLEPGIKLYARLGSAKGPDCQDWRRKDSGKLISYFPYAKTNFESC